MPEYTPKEVEHFEKSSFETMADIHAETIGVLTALSGQTEIAIEFGKIDKGSHVLELGCGPGQLTHALSEVAENVQGVDFAPNMIKAAQMAFPDLTFQIANGEKLPFTDSTFDVVVCNYTAFHLARPEVVFTEVLRTLTPSGHLVIIGPTQDKNFLFGAFRGALNAELPSFQLPRGPLSSTGPEGYVSLLSQCGYTNVQWELREKPLIIIDMDKLLQGITVDLHDQPEEIQDRIRAGTKDRSAGYQQPDGTYNFPDAVLVVTGQC